MHYLLGFRDLLVGILRRFYIWAPAILLDPFDLYARFRRDEWPELTIPVEWGLAALSGLLGLAAFLTYMESWKAAVSDKDSVKDALQFKCISPFSFIPYGESPTDARFVLTLENISDRSIHCTMKDVMLAVGTAHTSEIGDVCSLVIPAHGDRQMLMPLLQQMLLSERVSGRFSATFHYGLGSERMNFEKKFNMELELTHRRDENGTFHFNSVAFPA